jgi:peptidoglycan L-alanyl-D-glutamate endopeptidase CwlK
VKLSERSKTNRAGVDPRLIAISDLAIQLTLVDFGHGSYAGLRTADVQRHLYATGKSKADGVTKRSKHQDGKALDFYAYVDGAATWAPEPMAMVAAAFMQAASMLGYRVQWGGLWAQSSGGMYGWDMAHIELLED